MVAALAILLPMFGALAAIPLGSGGRARNAALVFLAGGLFCTILTAVGGPTTIHTGDGLPPVTIDLHLGSEVLLAFMAVYAASIMHALSGGCAHSPKAQALSLVMTTAALGLLASTDLFNSFVFIEIGSIVTIGLAAAVRGGRPEAAVKAALVSGLVTILFLLAIALVYRGTGELRLAAVSSLTGRHAVVASALLLTVITLEIKAFPLSGWGLDLLEGASPRFSSLYSATWSLAVLIWAARVLPLLPLPDPAVLAWIGAAGLLLGQLAGLRSSDPGRMLGYSSAGYAGLVLMCAGLPGAAALMPLVATLLVFQALAKYTLFASWGDGDSRSASLAVLLPVLALAGVPPMPTFWAKFDLLAAAAGVSPAMLAMAAAGLFLETVYLMRFWALRTPGRERPADRLQAFAGSGLLLAGTFWMLRAGWERLAWNGLIPAAPVIGSVFQVIFGAGTVLTLAAAVTRARRERSHWLWILVSGAALLALLSASGPLSIYLCWEVSTFAAVIAASRNRDSGTGAFWFAAFGSASGFLLLGGLLLGGMAAHARTAFVLLALAALVKMGQAGAHLWNVRAYSQSPTAVSAFLAGVSSKAAVLLLLYASLSAGGVPMGLALAWTGALTALFMAVKASLSGDYKKVLAYASVSQLGYVLVGLGLSSTLGWTAALYQTVHHFLFKTALLLGAAGVVYRTGLTDYDDLGGLVKRMPLTFSFTLVSVIAFAAVPPLAGFGGKWLLYQALIERGWLPVAVTAMFASVIAFLYSYRLLHSVFLGQLLPRHSKIREAPPAILVPQALLVGGIMLLSFKPTLFLERLLPAVQAVPWLDPSHVALSADTVTGPFGQWNAFAVGMMVMGVFGAAFVFYWLSGHRPVHVGQLDIGYAGELPPSQQEVHFSHAFYRHFKRALESVPHIRASKVFSTAMYVVDSLGDAMRAIFTGDGRTYLAYALIFLLVAACCLGGGL